MRLLEIISIEKGEIKLTKDLINSIPPYAILSHTWGDEDDEVTFEDLVDRTGFDKAGYNKIRFCAKQATSDGLKYFWIDTCCIDRSSSAELTKAINSMFRCYRDAAKCYAYMSDVSTGDYDENDHQLQHIWMTDFRKSKWFTRGWTLQELIAPAIVEFFSLEGKRLGDKRSMDQQVYEITGIPIYALQGNSLSEFSVADRMSWAANRRTTHKEDEAYCLLGIFGIHMPLIYGEGENAFVRLKKEIDATLAFQADQTSVVLSKLPQAKGAAFDSHADEDEPECHPDTRTDLLRQIQNWVDEPTSKCIFWLNGMAGTGKSTVSRTVARSLADQELLGASFFFKRGEGDRGNASKFFTTIAAQLAIRISGLIAHIAKALDSNPTIPDKAMKEQFEKLLLHPLSTIQREPSSRRRKLIIVIDALDECEQERHIKTILHLLPRSQDLNGVNLRIFVTSRPDLPVRLGFQQIDGDTHQDVALHEIPAPIIEHDLRAFLQDELARIRRDHSLPSTWPSHGDLQTLVEMAHPLFIFAATVCRFIGDLDWDPQERLDIVLRYQTSSQADKLDGTYLPVLNQLLAGRNNSEKDELLKDFRNIVGTIIVLVDPLTTRALAKLLCVSKSLIDRRLNPLYSVLSVPADQNSPVRLFHLSFREFLLDEKKRETSRFWIDVEQKHRTIAAKCIELMSTHTGLRENVCGLEFQGKRRSDVKAEILEKSLPLELRYACRYWVYHLQYSGDSIRDQDHIHIFLQIHLLHWLEAMSLLGKISESVTAIETAQSLLQSGHSVQCANLLYDARRFVLANRSVLNTAPLQIYSSALIFAPKRSVIKELFKECIPTWLRRLPEVQESWSANVQTFEGHRGGVTAVAFSPDGKQLASASGDNTVRLWDASSGETLQTFEGHSGIVWDVAFSPGGKQLASASNDKTVRLWDVDSGETVLMLEGHSDDVRALTFSPDGKQLASASSDRTIRLWDAGSHETLQTLEGHTSSVLDVTFSPNGKQLASASWDTTARLWDTGSGEMLQTLRGHSSFVNAVAFSPDGKQLASASMDNTVRLWDVDSGETVLIFEGHSNEISALAFSPDCKQLASASEDRTVRIWDVSSGESRQTFEVHSGIVWDVEFSPDGKQLASASSDTTVRLWDAIMLQTLQTFQMFGGHSGSITAVTFSPDGKQLASASEDTTVRLWDVGSHETLRTFEGHDSFIWDVTFSPDGKQLASASFDKTVRLWDTGSGETLQTFKGHSSHVIAVAFSPDGKQLASASWDKTVLLYDTGSGETLQKFKGHSESVYDVAFSPDGKQLVSASRDKTVLLYDTGSGETLQTFKGHSDSIHAVALSPDGKQLASASKDEVRLWDARSGEVLHTQVASVKALSFSRHGSYLETDRGLLFMECYKPSSSSSQVIPAEKVFLKGDWVTLNGQELLWLPPDYRPGHTAVYNSLIAIGCRSRRVVFLEF